MHHSRSCAGRPPLIRSFDRCVQKAADLAVDLAAVVQLEPFATIMAATILITGASGLLGTSLITRPAAAGYRIRAMSRQARPAQPGIEWATANLTTGDGLETALTGVDTIVHAAHDPRTDAGRGDIGGTQLLLAAAHRSAVRHVVFVSIVGIDRIPYPYYRHKLMTEDAVRSSSVPWTIVRGTQFHDYMDAQFRRFTRFPIGLLPKSWLGQPIHVDEFADVLWSYVEKGPSRRAPDVAGPQVLRYGDMMRAWLAAQGRRKVVLDLPIRGRMAAAFRSGGATAPDRAVGRMTWSEWLQARYGAAAKNS
jgi:uncharacterized protein YbjT (DUF2867 family)